MAYEKRDAACADYIEETTGNLDHYDFSGPPEDLVEPHREAVRDAFNAGWAARKAAVDYHIPETPSAGIIRVQVDKAALLNLVRAIEFGSKFDPNQFDKLREVFSRDEIATGQLDKAE